MDYEIIETRFVMQMVNPMTACELVNIADLPPGTLVSRVVANGKNTTSSDLVIRLDLDVAEYSALEKLVAIGVQALADRAETLHVLYGDSKKDPTLIPANFTHDDIDTIRRKARDEEIDAGKLLRKIKRPT